LLPRLNKAVTTTTSTTTSTSTTGDIIVQQVAGDSHLLALPPSCLDSVGSFFADVPEAGPLFTFCALNCLLMSFYGGTFSVLPSYIADLFFEKHAGAIHGRILTAWSTASIIGPQSLARLRDSSYNAACQDLVYFFFFEKKNIVKKILQCGGFCSFYLPVSVIITGSWCARLCEKKQICEFFFF